MVAVRPLIPLPDYQRIFRVVKPVLEGIDSDPARSCIFFSIAGAAILKQVYKVQCMPVAGAAFYAIDDEAKTVLSFAKREGDEFYSDEDAFHCWIQCDDYIIDFMAPLFRESMQRLGFSGHCSRRMFQKTRRQMAASQHDLVKPGDFYLQPNVDLTMAIMQRAFAKPATSDLVQICQHWYKKPPKDMPPSLSMTDDLGKIVSMKLSGLAIDGAW